MILVTGGTGLVGSHLLLELVKSGDKVRAIHRKDSDLQAVKMVFSYYIPADEIDFLFSKIEWKEADLNDIPALTEAFTGITNVYHCAALISFDTSEEKDLRKINIEGTANIVNLCVAFKIEKLCYISSIATMDKGLGEKFVTENFTWNQEKYHNEYAISKHGAEIEVWRGTQEGVPAIILNPGVILGPGFWNTGSGQLFKKISEGLNYHFPKTTGFVGVQDVVNAAITGMGSNIQNEQYIVVAENLSFTEVLGLVAASIQKPSPKKPLKPWMVFIGWIYQSITNFLFGSKKLITREDYKSLFKKSFYSSAKLKSEFPFEYTPIKEVILETGKIFRKEH
jgi:nucleoside-diphosphate-sugar epimerase